MSLRHFKPIYHVFIRLLLLLSSCYAFSLHGADNTTASEPRVALENNVTANLYFADRGVPWGMAWLPNGDLLMTFRGGALKQISAESKKASVIKGLPKIATGGQGGLLDIVLHPNYAQNGWLYFSYVMADQKGDKSTAIMRAKLQGKMLVEKEQIYVAQAYSNKGVHFGSRLAFDNQNYLYFSIGDRGQRDVNPQDLARDGGKIYRLRDDGSIPEDNPFLERKNAKQAIYSYGHRNPQGMAKHPKTGDIWIHEHGPKGGDEVNLIEKGKNYGWPVISYGINYSGTRFTELTHQVGMEQPRWYWDPSIAPSGMAFITSEKYPGWHGNLLVGSLKFGKITMLTLQGNEVTSEKTIIDNLTRVRNVVQGLDGYIYVAVDGKGVFRLEP